MQTEPAASGVQTARDDGAITISVAGRTVLRYQIAPDLPRAGIPPIFRRGGFMHPVFSPAGRIVSDSYAPNHLHHHGLWFSWTKTEFEGRRPDFWNMGQGTGTVEFAAVEETWSGAAQGGFEARHRFVDLSAPEPKVVLHETWRVTVHGAGENANVFDLTSTQQCATDSPLRLPEYHYGGLGFRGHRAWDGADKTFFLTSQGETDRLRGNATRARWCHIGGAVDGALTGIAMLGHPQNFRAPQPMRLHPDEPFFCFAPSQMGDWQIAPGETYISRYRFVVQDGAPDADELNRLWNDYAALPVANGATS